MDTYLLTHKKHRLQDSHLGVPFVMSGMAPIYLAADSQLSSEEDRRQPRSADSRTCVVRRTYSNSGTDVSRLPAQDCSSSRLWTHPAGPMQKGIGYEQFKRSLKTYLFRR